MLSPICGVGKASVAPETVMFDEGSGFGVECGDEVNHTDIIAACLAITGANGYNSPTLLDLCKGA